MNLEKKYEIIHIDEYVVKDFNFHGKEFDFKWLHLWFDDVEVLNTTFFKDILSRATVNDSYMSEDKVLKLRVNLKDLESLQKRNGKGLRNSEREKKLKEKFENSKEDTSKEIGALLLEQQKLIMRDEIKNKFGLSKIENVDDKLYAILSKEPDPLQQELFNLIKENALIFIKNSRYHQIDKLISNANLSTIIDMGYHYEMLEFYIIYAREVKSFEDSGTDILINENKKFQLLDLLVSEVEKNNLSFTNMIQENDELQLDIVKTVKLGGAYNKNFELLKAI